jgi:hypothetical protein
MVWENLQKKCDLFECNYQILKKNFKWNYAMMNRLGALLYTEAGLEVNVDAIQAAKDIIKGNTGIFSIFKDTTYFALSVLLSLEPNAEELFQNTLKVYKQMKDAGFHTSVYLTLAAFTIAKQTKEDEVFSVINRAKDFYDAMKRKHMFLTSTDDYGYAAMLSMTELSVPQAIDEMENCFELLRNDFGAGNVLQSLTHVLTLAEEPTAIKCERARQVYISLKRKDCKFSKYEQLSILGVLVMVSEDVEKLTEEIKEVYQILIEKKGFGSWSMSRHERTMFASALVAEEYIKDMKKNPLSFSLTNSITNIVIAQQTAMIIAASSASAAAASASN